MLYSTSEKQTDKILFLINEMLKSQPDGNPWRLKYISFTIDEDGEVCDTMILQFIDNTRLTIYYTVRRDGTHSYGKFNNIQRVL